MTCIDCKFLENDPQGSGLFICTNPESGVEYTGVCCEDECPYGESLFDETQLNEEEEKK